MAVERRALFYSITKNKDEMDMGATGTFTSNEAKAGAAIILRKRARKFTILRTVSKV